MRRTVLMVADGFRSELLWMSSGLRDTWRGFSLRRPPVWIALTLSIALPLWSGWLAWLPRSPVPSPVTLQPERPYSDPSRLRPPPTLPPVDYHQPLRPIPARFPLNSAMPAGGEGRASGSIGDVLFDPARDLIRIEDSRVWWESEHDDHTGDSEDDHVMHWAMEEPFRRLVELVLREGGTLKVQDSYRASGIHAPNSLHKQGRAIDLTATNLSLERLAALAWAAGFDWVYFEKAGGLHVHASVSPENRIRRSFSEVASPHGP